MAAITAQDLRLHGVKSEFFKRFHDTKTYYEDLTTRVPSGTGSETYAWLGALPQMRETLGGRAIRGLHTEKYTVANREYESTIRVDRVAMEDDQTGQIMLRIGEMAAVAATHKDYLLSQLLINGATTGFNSYDGVTFFNASHESGDSGTQSNVMTHASTAVPDDPTVAECKAALREAIARMMGFVNDRGDPLNLSAAGFVVVCPPSMMFNMSEAINATLIDSTTNVMQGIARVIPFSWLTNLSMFYLLKTDQPLRPFLFQDRIPIEFGEEDRPLDMYMTYGVRARYAIDYAQWAHAISMDFTA